MMELSFILWYIIYGIGVYMEIKTGYLYHIKDEFLDVVNDENLMTNHECGKKGQHILPLRIKIYCGLYL